MFYFVYCIFDYLKMFSNMSVGLGMFGTVTYGTSSTLASSAQRAEHPDPAAQPAGRVGGEPASALGARLGRESMDPRLLSHFMGARVSDEIIDKLGAAGVNSLALFASLGGSEDGFRTFLERPGMEIKAVDLKTSVEQASIVSAWRAANTMSHIEIEASTKRSLANLPPEVSVEEVEQHAKVFAGGADGFELTAITTPSKGYFESKVDEVQRTFKAEPWTVVTNLAQEEAHASRPSTSQSNLLSWDSASSGFRLQTKAFGIGMPQTSEGFRMRIRIWGLGWIFLKQRFPQKPQLQTATIGLFDRYQEWLFGPQVWGLVTLGPDLRPMSCPSLTQVLGFDFAVRKKVALLMNSGIDIKAAFGYATADPELRQTQFTASVGVAINTAECRALSAPGLREAYALQAPGGGASRGGGQVQPPPIADGEMTRSQAQRVKKKAAKARKQAEDAKAAKLAKAQKPPKALQNGGKGDGTRDKGKGKGKGPPRKKVTEKTEPIGSEICYGYNNNNKCSKGKECSRAHVCQICEGPHPASSCPDHNK